MKWLSRESQTTNMRTDEWPFRVIVAATVVLIATAILGNLLVGIPVGPFQFFWFRLYLPFYAVGFGWFLWKTRGSVRSLPVAGWLFIGFGIYVAISALWAVNANGLLYGLFALESALFVMAAVYWTAVNRRALVLYLGAIIALVAVGEAIALWEIATNSHLWTSRFVRAEWFPNHKLGKLDVPLTTAWFYNRNGFGFFLGLAVGPLFAWARWSDRGPAARGLAVGMLVLAGILLYNNGTRSALAMAALAIVGMEVLAALRVRLRARTPSRTDRWAVTAGMFGAALLAVVVLIVVTNPFVDAAPSLELSWQFTESLPILSRPKEQTSSLAVRWTFAVKGVQMLFWSNGLGVGVNSFSAAYKVLWGVAHVSPHNWLTNLLAEFGVIGTGLFLAAYARILYDVGARYITTDDWLCLGLFGTVVSLPIGALGPANALYSHHSMWIFIGLAAAVAYRVQRSNFSL